ADFFPKNRPELVEEFKTLPKLKEIFLESFKKSTKETFETNFDKIYSKIGGTKKEYIKFYGSALLMAEEFRKNWDSIIPIKNPAPLNSRSKKRKADAVLEDERRRIMSEERNSPQVTNEVDQYEVPEERNNSQEVSRDQTNILEELSTSQRRKHPNRVRFDDGSVVHEIPVLNPEDKGMYEENRQNYTFNEFTDNLASDQLDFITHCPGVDEDSKVINIDNSENALAALPYAFNPIPAPASCPSSEWISQANGLIPKTTEEFKEILMKFHFSQPIPRQRNLFIFDTLLKPLKTHTVMKYSEGIDLSFPTSFSVFFQALQEVRKMKKNAYIIPRIYIAYGMDLAIRAMDRDCCAAELDVFLNKLMKNLEEDFGPKSPARFKNADSDEPVSPQFPNICLITIPYCRTESPGVIDFNDRFRKVNNFLRKVVKEKNGFKGRVVEIIDWQRIISRNEEEDLSKVSKEMVDLRAYRLHEAIFKDQKGFLISK
ncbi:hypothetical protein FO519_007055, partial [Halicephalobus sp. NKZ332]